MWEVDMTIIYGEEILLINAQETISMVAKGSLMATTMWILLWVENLLLLIQLISNMEEFKLKQNYQKEIGYGRLFGFYPDTINMVNGQLVVK